MGTKEKLKILIDELFINDIINSDQCAKFKNRIDKRFSISQASDETKIINENETLIKNCSTCKHYNLPIYLDPCFKCRDYRTYWERDV